MVKLKVDGKIATQNPKIKSKEVSLMEMWKGVAITVGIVILALVVYDKWIKGKVTAA